MSDTTFRFRCFGDLRHSLGRMDAICSFLYISESQLRKTMAEQKHPGQWLSKMGHEMGIIIDHVDEKMMPSRLAELYILAVFTHLMEFIESAIVEHPSHPTWNRNNDETSLDFLLRNLGMLKSEKCKTERAVVEYYRLVRNRLMHPKVKETRISKMQEQLRELLGVRNDGPPHKCGEMNYSDFDLFTRNVKSLAEKICTMGRPANEQICEMLSKDRILGLRRYKNNERRFRNAVRQLLRMVYKLEDNEAGPISELLWGALA